MAQEIWASLAEPKICEFLIESLFKDVGNLDMAIAEARRWIFFYYNGY